MAATDQTVAGAATPGKSIFGLSGLTYLILLAIFIALPFMSKSFFVFQITQMLVYAIAIIGLNLLTGINGQFSLGHGAFYAVGAGADHARHHLEM